MDVHQAIKSRRAYRALDPVPITRELIDDLASSARLAPSCFNNQPWRFVFVTDENKLERMFTALSDGNIWARNASMIVAVFSREEDDCVIRERIYHQFDVGLGTAFMILRAAELGLVAHPIAGFSPKKTREILGIPAEYKVITLVIVGKKAKDNNPQMTEKQKKTETKRPERLPLERFVFLNNFPQEGN
ncbi:nitroreductase family protein [Acidobacteriota bacterium]